MTVYLLRHGETTYNAEKRYQGTRDVPLSAKGRAELAAADFCPKKVYVSPLSRAVDSAKILFPTAELCLVEDLKEMCFGDFEGKNYIEMGDDPDYHAWVEGWCMGKCPGSMEDRAAFIRRTCDAFARLMDEALQNGEEQLVIVAHGGTQMAILDQFSSPHRDYYDWKAGNGAGFVLDAADWPQEKTLSLLKEVQYTKENRA